MAAFYTNFLRNIRDSQGKDGSMTDFVPFCDEEDDDPIIVCDRSYARPADPSWGTAYPSILFNVYQEYADERLALEHYPHIRDYVDNLTSLTNSTTGNFQKN